MPPFVLRRQFFVFAPPTAKLMRTKKRLSHRCRRWLRGGRRIVLPGSPALSLSPRSPSMSALAMRRIASSPDSPRSSQSSAPNLGLGCHIHDNVYDTKSPPTDDFASGERPPTALQRRGTTLYNAPKTRHDPLQRHKDAERPTTAPQRRGTAPKAAKGRQRPQRGDLRCTSILKAAKGRHGAI